MFDLKSHKEEFEKQVTHFKEELKGLRTGRANSNFIEHILVDSYGVPTPIKHVASISIPDARTILITPWDSGLSKEIEKSITLAELGVNPVNDGAGVRIVLPQLTEENRKNLAKVVGQKQEHAKITIRLIRDAIRDDIQKGEKEKEITEDEKFRLQKDLDEMTKEYGSFIDGIADEKEQEIMTI